MASEREIDPATQTETTGHEWDGIRELDTPMPRWWLLTFYGTIIWGVIYVILFPAWPLIHGATPGLLGYSSRATVARELDAAATANAPLDARLMETDIATVEKDPELLSYAMAGGAAIFRNNCSQCHGAGGGGTPLIYPNLADDDWLWGGTATDIETTVTHGIRYEADPDTRYSQMPSFGEILEPAQIDAVANYVLSLSGSPHDAGLAAEGAPVFAENCASCHGETGTGGREFGAPNLSDQIWLYGGAFDQVHASIVGAHFGIMPAFGGRLTAPEIRKVAIFVNTLGGGE
jgi:cytochrome c oxidase cbb3-type subunit 3